MPWRASQLTPINLLNFLLAYNIWALIGLISSFLILAVLLTVLLLAIVIAVVIVGLDELLLLHLVLLLRLVAIGTRIVILRKFLLLLCRRIFLHLLLQMHIGSLLFGQVLLYLLDFTGLDSWFPAVIRRGGSFPVVDLWCTERSHVARSTTARHIVELHVHIMLR